MSKHTPGPFTTTERKANHALLSAAPELYHALKGYVDGDDCGCEAETHQDGDGTIYSTAVGGRCRYCEALSILAKAEGES